MEQVLSRPVEPQEHRAIGLIPSRDGSALAGVLFIDMRTGHFAWCALNSADGNRGGPTMYKYHTPSGDKTMDGLAMAMARRCAIWKWCSFTRQACWLVPVQK